MRDSAIGDGERHEGRLHQPSPQTSWRPTHRLRWSPRTGRGLEWPVQIEDGSRDGRPISFARTEEEALHRLPASWVRDGDAWLWNGRRGFLGADGSVRLLPLAPLA